MAWREWLQPLDVEDPGNARARHTSGERIRVRLNIVHGQLVDYVVQYETPNPVPGLGHLVVLRSDGTHAPHYDVYDWRGNRRVVPLDAQLSAKAAVDFALADIESRWQALREAFFRGLS